jgi:HD-GYP domain-containing protein (c-di-GMP phosphodiesterase class II)
MASALGVGDADSHFSLALAAFLHDLPLKDDDLARISSLSELTFKSEGLQREQVEAFMKHPEEAAQLVRQLRDVPAEVAAIVEQHHERPDGTGFPKELGFAKIGRLSSIFILAHELYRYSLSQSSPPTIQAWLKDLDPSFKKGNFGVILAQLAKSA